MRKFLLLLLGVFFSVILHSQTICISNVTVIDVKNGKVLPAYSVIINGDRIEQVGPASKVKIPANATLVEGSGKFLLPGMTDAHIHFFQSGGLYTRPDVVDMRNRFSYEKEMDFAFQHASDYLRHYLRLGITSVIDVGGPMSNFIVRDSISRLDISPNVLVTGPLFSMVESPKLGTDKPIVKVVTTQDADSLFAKMLPRKPDFIKIWYIAGPGLPAEKNFPLVKYIAEKAHQNGLRLTVHATELNTAKLAVEAGADILVHSVFDEVIPDSVVQSWKTKKVTYIPTLIVTTNYYKVFTGRLGNHPQDLAWANPTMYGTLTDPEGMTDAEMPAVFKALRKTGIPASEAKADSVAALNLAKLYKAGVNIAAGTDAGNIGTFHASSYLQELEAMQAAGLTTAQVIQTATLNPAIGFGKDKDWGSIEKGKMADMILLDKNPLLALQNLNAIQWIFKSGRMIKADTLINESPEEVVQRQLNAYNARNIDGFMDTYADDVELYDYPAKLLGKGKAEMRQNYESFFKQTPNLYCAILGRITIGNKVIDREKVRANNNTFNAAAYEVENGKIKKVTFIR